MYIVVVPQMSSGEKSDVYCCSSTDEFWRKFSCLHLDNGTQHYSSKRLYEPKILNGFELHSNKQYDDQYKSIMNSRNCVRSITGQT
jgi:hypothetical protein